MTEKNTALAVFPVPVLYIIMFIFKVVTLIFFLLAEYESKKMWSKFDNVTVVYGT